MAWPQWTLAAEYADTTRPRIVEVEYSDVLRGTMIDGTFQRVLEGNVRLRQDEVHMFADRATLFRNYVNAAGNIAISQHDTLWVYADSLRYIGDTRMAYFYDDVVLVDGTRQLFTDLLEYDLNERVGIYRQGALLTNMESRLRSRRGRYLAGPGIAYFTDSVVLTHPDFMLWTDSLDYYSEEQRAVFRGPTIILQDSAYIYAENGYYLMDDKYAWFSGNVRLDQGEEYGEAHELRYDGNLDLMWLIGEAEVWDGRRRIYGDTILYNRREGTYATAGRSTIVEGTRTIFADDAEYRSAESLSILYGRVEIIDEDFYLSADTIYYYNEADSGAAYGNVYFSDTASGVALKAGNASFVRGGASIEAWDNPLLMYLMEDDTLYIAADTIYSMEMPEHDSLKLVRAYPRSLVYKSDVQGMADSLVYTEWDSTFSFFGDPVIWADSAQFTADTIRMFVAEGAIDMLSQTGRSFILHFPNPWLANQVRGRDIDTYFSEGKADYMDVDGNAQVVYFATDDHDAYIGVNHADCSRLNIRFEDNRIHRITFVDQPTGTMYPMSDKQAVEHRLEHFSDRRKQRPLSSDDLLPGHRFRAFAATDNPD